MKFNTYYRQKQKLIEKKLDSVFSKQSCPPRLKKAMQYSLLAGGKRLRPSIILMTDDILRKSFKGSHKPDIIRFAISLECIHTYSLIHDDLPAMDDDDLRRGRPTCHKRFDEATAILAGDALLTFAFENLFHSHQPDSVTRSILSLLSNKAGFSGMVGGQMLDMDLENKKVSLKQLENIHMLKTGALFEACFLIPILYHQRIDLLTPFKQFSRQVGLAFQVIDDILDVTATEKVLGKPAGSDIKNVKNTYVSLLGLKRARLKARSLYTQSLKTLDKIPLDTSYLADLSRFIIDRLN